MSENETDLKIGGFYYLHPKTQNERNDPENWIRLPWIITDVQMSNKKITLETLPDKKIEIPLEVNYLEECSQEDFLKFCSSRLTENETEVSKLEKKLLNAKQEELRIRMFLQEKGIKVQ